MEQRLLGSLMIDLRKIDEVTPIVGRDDFSVHAYRLLWDHVTSAPREVVCDHQLLASWLLRAGDLDEIGGKAQILEVAQSEAVAAHAKFYAERVAAMAVKRRGAEAAIELLKAAYNPALTTSSYTLALPN